MWSKPLSFKTCIPQLISQYQKKLDSLVIKSFDIIYDEDHLNSTYEKLDILSNKIADVLREPVIDYDVLNKFMDMKQSTEQEIEELLLQRAVKYAEWKKHVMQIHEERTKLEEEFQELMSIENEFNRIMQNRKKLDVLTVAKLHHKVNVLLKLSGHAKENTPYASFFSAYNKQLIDNALCKRLISRNI